VYERFTDRARKVMQLANQESQRFNHEYVGTEHILLGLIKEGSGVAANVMKNLDLDLRKVRLEVEKVVQSGPDMVTMGHLPQTPRAKKVIEYAIEEARNFNHNYVGTEHLLLGLLREEEGVAAQVLMNLGVVLADAREEVLHLLGHNMATEQPSGTGSAEPASGSSKSKTPTLDRVSCDLTALARQGKLDLPAGRVAELEAALLVLACRSRNNLLLVGEPGVGKTRLLEGLAVLALKSPEPLPNYRFVAVSPAQLCLTPEKSTLAILHEAQRAENVVLVLDDLALFLDPARSPGGRVVGNLVRAALAWGGASCVATTTPGFYESILRGDEVFGTHFQPLCLAPPSFDDTLAILRAVADRYATHHRTTIDEGALEAAVRLSAQRTDRAFPAKAIELLDRACARVRLRAATQPAEFKDLDGQIERLNLEKDVAVAEQDFEKAAQLRDRADKVKKRKEALVREWKEQNREASGVVDAEAVTVAWRLRELNMVDLRL
jgi:ATP-dependent Clp protease ATP-binding subunit ClpC